MKKVISYSSIKYLLKVEDLLGLQVADGYFDSDEVIILMGNEEEATKDNLFSGLQSLKKAQKDKMVYIDTKIAYYTFNNFIGFFVNLIKKLKRNNYVKGSDFYHTPLEDISRKNLTRGVRTTSNAYEWTNKKWAISEDERKKRYSTLYNSIKEKGYNPHSPILILLNRSLGVRDQILQGHHRLNICSDLGVKEITIKFWASPSSPSFMKPLDMVISKIKGMMK